MQEKIRSNRRLTKKDLENQRIVEQLKSQLDETKEASKSKEMELSKKLAETESQFDELSEELDNLKVSKSMFMKNMNNRFLMKMRHFVEH